MIEIESYTKINIDAKDFYEPFSPKVIEARFLHTSIRYQRYKFILTLHQSLTDK